MLAVSYSMGAKDMNIKMDSKRKFTQSKCRGVIIDEKKKRIKTKKERRHENQLASVQIGNVSRGKVL